MATRLDKIMEPILKEKCDEAYKAGYKKGFEAGGKNMSLAYENEINSLKRELGRKRFLLKDNGEIIPLDHRWIPVTERLPEPWKWILCYCEAGNIEMLRHDDFMDEWGSVNINRAYKKDYVTHWMPLPEPPKGE